MGGGNEEASMSEALRFAMFENWVNRCQLNLWCNFVVRGDFVVQLRGATSW